MHVHAPGKGHVAVLLSNAAAGEEVEEAIRNIGAILAEKSLAVPMMLRAVELHMLISITANDIHLSSKGIFVHP